jgi:hypothetical protein
MRVIYFKVIIIRNIFIGLYGQPFPTLFMRLIISNPALTDK